MQDYAELKSELKNWRQIIKDYSTPNARKANWQVATSFGPFLLVCALMYLSLDISYWLTLALAFLNGFFLVRIFIIQHDAGHQSFYSSRKANNRIGWLCSLFTLIPYRYWSRTHAFHHAHSGQLDERDIGDITTLTVAEYHALKPAAKIRYRIYRSIPVMFFIGPVYYVFIHGRIPWLNRKGWEKDRKALKMSNLYLPLIYVAAALIIGWKAFLMVQIPALVSFAVIAIWFFYIQHQHNPNYKRWKDDWEYLVAAIKGSTFYKLPRLFHWLTGNIGFHHIHHLSTRIPNYYLRKCNEDHPAFERHTVAITFLESLKCATHKLWDDAELKMITFREYYKLEKNGKIALPRAEGIQNF